MIGVGTGTGTVDVIEAAYRTDLPSGTWIKELATTAMRAIGAGASAFGYRIDQADQIVMMEGFDHVGAMAEFAPMLRGMVEAFTPEYVRKTSAPDTVRASATESGPPEIRAFTRAKIAELYVPHGIHDVFVVNGIDPSSHGVYVNGMVGAPRKLSRRQRATWSRVAAHLAAAFRLRRGLAASAQDTPEAVVRPGGRIEHADGEAKSALAREQLRDAAIAINRARTRGGGRTSPPRSRCGRHWSLDAGR